jgi:DnaJ-class molecular chaperone
MKTQVTKTVCDICGKQIPEADIITFAKKDFCSSGCLVRYQSGEKKDCPSCNGTGGERGPIGGVLECWKCSGTGKVNY